MPERALEVLAVGPQVTVQDLGRPGHAHLGVPRSGALDEPAHRLGNRLVGNPESHATLECLGGGLVVRCGTALSVAVTGARVPVTVSGRAREWGRAVSVPAGAVVELGTPTAGLRAYLAVAGGIDVEPVLGSRSTDLLSGLGPEPVSEGDVLPVGPVGEPPVPVEAARPPAASYELRVRLGPREDRFEPEALVALHGASYVVGSRSNRIGLRLEGPVIARKGDEVQVPPNGQPVVFLHDHPTTGGYPVVGVVLGADLAVCAQLRPGDAVTLRVV